MRGFGIGDTTALVIRFKGIYNIIMFSIIPMHSSTSRLRGRIAIFLAAAMLIGSFAPCMAACLCDEGDEAHSGAGHPTEAVAVVSHADCGENPSPLQGNTDGSSHDSCGVITSDCDCCTLSTNPNYAVLIEPLAVSNSLAFSLSLPTKSVLNLLDASIASLVPPENPNPVISPMYFYYCALVI